MGAFAVLALLLELTQSAMGIRSTSSPEGGTLKPRYYPQAVVQGSAIFTVNGRISVKTGIVRWVQGARFGVKFIEMDSRERFHYNAIVGALLNE